MAIVRITKDNYEELVLQSAKPVLLDFWATWCGPCRMIAPILEEIAGERDDVVIGKINVDEEMALAVDFQIVSIPTLILMEGGNVKAKTIGYCPKEEILALLNP